jgi:hypothetical protein
MTDFKSVNYIKVTPEFHNSCEHIEYVVKMNGAEVCIADNKETARKILESLASQEMKQHKTDITKVYKQDLEDNKIIVSVQQLGTLWNGKVSRISTIEYCAVSKAFLSVPTPPPPPPTFQTKYR